MINLNTLTQTLTAAFGAILISTAFVAASVGPVHAVPTQTAQASAQVHA